MTGMVRDLAWVPHSQRSALQRALEQAVDLWHRHWVADRTGAAASCLVREADDGLDADWQADPDVSRNKVWWRHDPETRGRVAAMLMGRDSAQDASAGEDWALAIVDDALLDLRARVSQALGLNTLEAQGASGQLYEASPGSDGWQGWLRPYAGGLIAEIQPAGLQCLMASNAYARFQAADHAAAVKDATIVPMGHWLKPARIGLSLELGTIDVTVSDLSALRIGDVVRFPARLEEPLSARITPSATCAPASGHAPPGAADLTLTLAGDLGHLGDHVALRLVATPHKTALKNPS